MTISYPINIPSGREADIARITLTPIDTIAVAMSPFTRQTQVYEWPGKAWQLVVELNPLTRAVADEWMAFLTSLRGQYGTFKMGDPSAATPRGTATGSPRVATGSESGLVVSAYGFTGSLTNILRRGDFVQIDDSGTPRLYMNLQDVNTTSGGVCDLDLWPAQRGIPASGSTIIVNSAHTVWRLTGTPGFNKEGPGIYTIAFSAEEAL